MKRNSLYRLMISFIVLASVALFLFFLRFRGLPSDDLQDWAHFGNYLAGTVGVAALIATLDALIFTINQQDKMLEQQEKQLKSYDEHQRKVEAYSRAEKIFPKLLEERKRALEGNVYEHLKKSGLVGEFFTELPMDTTWKDLLTDKQLADRVAGLEPGWILSMLSLHAHSGNYRLVCFMRDCILDAEELRDYFFSMLDEYDFLVTVTIAFCRAKVGDEEGYKLSRVFDVPELWALDGSIEKIWEGIGFKIQSSGFKVRMSTYKE
ncbi:hypothetical protein [Billgrantia desiderata]|uniref:hypothetical protein n=1 Tax=Billgrantia desiderata TaxID=52021 RepID=UPI00089ED76C|nr:hypothetical protein [Halomonas desiderata]SEG44157.1 hypothetical protein SAMN04487953_13329 [Halomonas desiderata]